MKYTLLAFYILLLVSNVASAQSVVCSRTATLSDGDGYSMEGTAVLEELDNGMLQLRLLEDFDTDRGPDVQIFLSNNRKSIAGAHMIVDIGTTDGLAFFSGATTFPINDTSISIDEFNYLTFRCISFNAFWGGGMLAASSCGNGGMNTDSTMTEEAMCLESAVATTAWASEVTICPNDGVSDIIPFMNSASDSIGFDYAYIIADQNNRIRKVVFEDSYDFEGSALESDFVFGVSYVGELSYTEGEMLSTITADSCVMLSSSTNFLTVNKESCGTMFNCFESATATTAWSILDTICPTDGVDDIVPLLNNQFQAPGDNYSYILTDTFNVILEVVNDTAYNFEGSGLGVNRIFGVSYEDSLSAPIGAPISMISATGCFQISDTSNLFLTIVKAGCVSMFDCIESSTATTDWATTDTICPNDGIDDFVELRNNQFAVAGDNYAYIITDENNLIVDLVTDTVYNFEGTGDSVNHVYGVSYDSNLQYQIGQSISTITADGCLQMSDTSNLFLTIVKGLCISVFECIESSTATTDWATTDTICAGDGIDDLIPFRNNQFVEAGSHYAYIIADESNLIVDVITDTVYNFDDSGDSINHVYGASYDGNLQFEVGQPISSITAEGCFQISDTSNLFLTIIKSGCEMVVEPDTATFTISGTIANSAGAPIRNVQVRLNESVFTVTDAEGRYEFTNLDANTNYTVRPSFNEESINGVSTTDLVLTARHILATRLFTSPYQIIAGDVNKNGSVSSVDITQLRLIILGRVNEFSDNTSWRFINAAQDLSNMDANTVLMESISVDLSSGSLNDVNFVGVKIGDVNGNANLDLR